MLMLSPLVLKHRIHQKIDGLASRADHFVPENAFAREPKPLRHAPAAMILGFGPDFYSVHAQFIERVAD